MIRSKILGVGSYHPPKAVTNDDLSKIMDTSDEWIQQRSGIKQRYWAGPEETTSDLAVQAALRALESSKVKKEELDMIICGTLSNDHDFPGLGCFVQAKLGVPGIPAIDVRQQCTSFIYGMSVADAFIRSGQYKKILVIGAELHSRGLDRTTRGREVTVLFGDGAGAVVMAPTQVSDNLTEANKQAGLFSTHLHADGSYAKELWLPGPGMALSPQDRITHENLDEGLQFPKMNGKVVFVNAVKKMPEAIVEALKTNQLKLEDIDLFLFHQANMRINEMVAKQMNIPAEKVFNTIQEYGNTTAATIPIGMDEAIKAGKLKPGMIVATAAFGSGFTWASAIFRF